MIYIEYTKNSNQFNLCASGHAGSGQPGHDLVCAAVSALVYTLAQTISFLGSANNAFKHCSIDLNSGNSSISCVPEQDFFRDVQTVFETIAIGLEYLSKNEPQYLKFTLSGVDPDALQI